MRLHTAFLGLAFATLLLGSGAVGQEARPKTPAIKITSLPVTITASGNYVLAGDLASGSPKNNAITVDAADVLIDLGGHRLTCKAKQTNANAAIGVSLGANGKNLRIQNGIIDGFFQGIKSTGGDGEVLVDDVTITNCGSIAVEISSTYAEVRSCRIYSVGFLADTFDTLGISVDADDTVIEGNEIGEISTGAGHSSTGIKAVVGRSAMIRENKVGSQTAALTGISCDTGTAAGAFLVGNILQKFTTGISMTGVGSSKYVGNVTSSCTTAFSGGTAVGSGNN